MESLVAHQAFDETDLLAVRGPAWNCHLKGWFINRLGLAGCKVDDVDLSHPPIVVAWTWSSGDGKAGAVGRPIEIVDVEVGGRDLGQPTGGDVEHGEALIVNLTADNAGLGLGGIQRSAAAPGFGI